MFDHLFNAIPSKTQGFIGIILGALILFGAFGSLGVLQAFFHTIMLVAGVILLFWGIEKSDLLKGMKKR